MAGEGQGETFHADPDPETHQASIKMATGSFLLIKQPGSFVDQPFSFSVEVKESVELYLCPSSGALLVG